MIVIDTNVLLRYLLNDDKAQAAKATRLIQANARVFVSNVVLVETIWTLTGKKYRLAADAVSAVVQALLEEPSLVFEDPHVVWRALSDFRLANAEAGAGAGFPDALILNVGKAAARSMAATFDGFHTFDSAAQGLPGGRQP